MLSEGLALRQLTQHANRYELELVVDEDLGGAVSSGGLQVAFPGAPPGGGACHRLEVALAQPATLRAALAFAWPFDSSACAVRVRRGARAVSATLPKTPLWPGDAACCLSKMEVERLPPWGDVGALGTHLGSQFSHPGGLPVAPAPAHRRCQHIGTLGREWHTLLTSLLPNSLASCQRRAGRQATGRHAGSDRLHHVRRQRKRAGTLRQDVAGEGLGGQRWAATGEQCKAGRGCWPEQACSELLSLSLRCIVQGHFVLSMVSTASTDRSEADITVFMHGGGILRLPDGRPLLHISYVDHQLAMRMFPTMESRQATWARWAGQVSPLGSCAASCRCFDPG